MSILVCWFSGCRCFYPLLLDHIQFAYTILFFAASDFTCVTRHIKNWASYPLSPSCFIHSELLVILPHSSPVAYWTPSDLGDSSFGVIPFWPFIEFMRFSQQVYWGGLPILLQWITFCQNSLLWPSLGWPCMAWLIASLNYTSPFVTARQWSLKGTKTKSPACHQITKRSRTKISTLTVCFLCILHIISLFAFYIFLYYLGQLKYLFSWINVLLWYRKFHIALNIYFLSHIYPLIFE